MPSTRFIAVFRCAVVTASAGLFLGACVHDGERVFARQSKAASALATMSMEAEAANSKKVDTFYAAEDKLHAACAPLRTVASRRMSGETVGLDSELAAMMSLDRCSVETQRAEKLIWVDDPAVARVFLGSPR